MTNNSTHSAGSEFGFTLLENIHADKSQPWSQVQDNILNDAGFDLAKSSISSWPGYETTPLVSLAGMAREIGISKLYYKDEGGRFGLGSFKALGGAYAVARLLQQKVSARVGKDVSMDEIVSGAYPEVTSKINVCSATDGNHGRSVAWGAQSFGCSCVIFIHATVSEGRKTSIESYGAEVRRCEGNFDDSVRETQQISTREGWFVVSDTSYPGYMDIPKDVMQGYELMGAEALDQMGTPPTHIFLQTGVGGMAAAVAAQGKRRWGSQRPTIVLVDPDRSACWLESFRHGQPTAIDGDQDTLMAGLACGEVSELAWEILKDHGDAAMAIPDTAAVEMMQRLAAPTGGDTAIAAGESAVAGLAGLVIAAGARQASATLGLGPDARVLVFGTEGDTDPELYKKLVGMDAATVRKGVK